MTKSVAIETPLKKHHTQSFRKATMQNAMKTNQNKEKLLGLPMWFQSFKK